MATPKMMTPTFILMLFLINLPSGYSSTITLVNKYKNTIWPAIVSSKQTTSPLFTTGFALQAGESIITTVPPSWSGHVWGRTLCSQDSTGKFSCVTGDCASSTVECVGGQLNSPATIVELTFNVALGLNSYKVSLIYGYNLAMKVEPLGERSNFIPADCTVDLNIVCPEEMKVISGGEVVACKSGCQVFGESTQFTCEPSLYSHFFNNTCSDAYLGAYTCPSVDYLITFQPTSLMESGHPTTMGNTQALFKIIEWAVGVILFLLGGYATYKVRCFFSIRECDVECNTSEA